MTKASEYNFDADAKLQKFLMNDEYWDASVEISQKAIDFHGAARVLSNLIDTKMSSSYTDC